MNNSKGIIYLVPVPIAEGAFHTLPAEVMEVTSRLQYYFAENARTSRRFLRSIHADLKLEPIQFSEIDKHTGIDTKLLRTWLKEGKEIGIMSEAGCPGIADPGADLVKLAHEAGATVKPLTGPSSLLLALMASGLSGQSFSFSGYLPVKDPAKKERIKELELRSAAEKQTQIFIETPYRNNSLLEDLLKNCKDNTQLCIAQNLTTDKAFVKTKTVRDWKAAPVVLEKAPAVFLILA